MDKWQSQGMSQDWVTEPIAHVFLHQEESHWIGQGPDLSTDFFGSHSSHYSALLYVQPWQEAGDQWGNWYLLMHLRLGVVQWAVFVFLLITHSVSEDVPAFRLKPELQTYLSLEFTL